jgi:hypothetical protein
VAKEGRKWVSALLFKNMFPVLGSCVLCYSLEFLMDFDFFLGSFLGNFRHFFFIGLGMEPRILHMIGKHFTTELHH